MGNSDEISEKWSVVTRPTLLSWTFQNPSSVSQSVCLSVSLSLCLSVIHSVSNSRIQSRNVHQSITSFGWGQDMYTEF